MQLRALAGSLVVAVLLPHLIFSNPILPVGRLSAVALQRSYGRPCSSHGDHPCSASSEQQRQQQRRGGCQCCHFYAAYKRRISGHDPCAPRRSPPVGVIAAGRLIPGTPSTSQSSTRCCRTEGRGGWQPWGSRCWRAWSFRRRASRGESAGGVSVGCWRAWSFRRRCWRYPGHTQHQHKYKSR